MKPLSLNTCRTWKLKMPHCAVYIVYSHKERMNDKLISRTTLLVEADLALWLKTQRIGNEQCELSNKITWTLKSSYQLHCSFVPAQCEKYFTAASVKYRGKKSLLKVAHTLLWNIKSALTVALATAVVCSACNSPSLGEKLWWWL